MAYRNKAVGVLTVLLASAGVLGLASCIRRTPGPDIVVSSDAGWHERAAARELRRYFYLRTGTLPEIERSESLSGVRSGAVVIVQKGGGSLAGRLDPALSEAVGNLGEEDFFLKSVPHKSGAIFVAAGGAGPAVLYAAYGLAEKLGVRFSLEGDVIPDFKAARFDISVDELCRPLFPVRGIQPFHDFPEGPDWWSREVYKAVIGQLPKLRMNFFGLHTYPENPNPGPGATPNAEPTVWIGLPEDSGPGGNVGFSYPASYQNTARGNWGYEAKRTSDFHFGAGLLFDSDDFGNDVMSGFCPEPVTPGASNAVFERAADVFSDVFSLARKLGVKTCVGTETPLTVPRLVKGRLAERGLDPRDPAAVEDLYRGIFRRVAAACPVDYYWLWTNEGWTWEDASEDKIRAVTSDLEAAVRAWRGVGPPFRLATCGWVLGPPSNRTLFDQILPDDVAMSCINRDVGKAPVDPGFSRLSGRPKWAIPWLEDDPALTSPQLWVGRMRRDAADALRYGCDGLLGIHWRTRILSANVMALARAAWEQPWSHLPRRVADEVGPITGHYIRFDGQQIAGAGADDRAVYQDVREGVFAYHLPVPNGVYSVTLKFVEGQVDRSRGRVFDIFLQGRKVFDSLDIFARAGRFRALDLAFPNVEVADGRLDIDFADRIHTPAVAAIVVRGRGFEKRVNCGGPAAAGYDADWPETPRHLDTIDFYRDWALSRFGPSADLRIAALFARLDGVHPVPATWIGGPGNIRPDPRPWDEVEASYEFVDEMKALGAAVSGPGYRERFDYWLGNFEYMRDVARYCCLWAEYDAALAAARSKKDPAAVSAAVRTAVLPIRREMAAALERIFGVLLANVGTTGELGTIANWEQHILPAAWEKPQEELRRLLGDELPRDVILPTDYRGRPRIIVPAARTSLEAGEDLSLEVLVLSKDEPRAVELHWRELGRGEFRTLVLEHSARGVYRVRLPAPPDDLEYYLTASADGKETLFPATAPGINRTVVVFR